MSEEDFDEFYRTTRQRVFRCVYALVGDVSEAQDVVQEAYVRAWQRWGRLARYGDPEGWVRTVAWRVAVSRFRRHRNRLLAQFQHGDDRAPRPPDDDALALAEALRAIPTDQQRAIVLHHVAGYSVAEIAADTGVAVGTVKSRLARGRESLARLLGTGTKEDSHAI